MRLAAVIIIGWLGAVLVRAPPAHATRPVGVYAGPGTWHVGVTALGAFLDNRGVPWDLVYPTDLNETDFSSRYAGLVIPGGDAGPYVEHIDLNGNDEIRETVSGGGFFLGICAGGYYACERIVWEDTPYAMPLGLFDGVGIGAIDEIAPWPQYTMTTVHLDPAHAINQGGNAQENILYYGGAAFFPDVPAAVETVGTYDVTGDPAIVTCSYGAGRVCLWGPHPEIEEDSNRDGSVWGNELDDNGSDWPLLTSALLWVVGGAVAAPEVSPGGDRSEPGELLGNPVPNPFRRETTLRLRLARAGGTSVRIHDVLGRVVRDLVAAPLASGPHEVRWDGRDESGAATAPGTYFARIESGGRVLTRKMTLIR